MSPALEATSAVLTIVRRHFSELSDLELAFTARVIARGHAAHFVALRDSGVPPLARAREPRKRALQRARDLDHAFSCIASYHAFIDLSEEHDASLNASLDRLLKREADRHLAEVYDPHTVGCSSGLADLLPPREHLPDRVPEILRPFYGPTGRPLRKRYDAPKGGVSQQLQ